MNALVKISTGFALVFAFIASVAFIGMLVVGVIALVKLFG